MSMTSQHPTEVAASFAFAVLPLAAFTQVLQTLIQSFHCFTDFLLSFLRLEVIADSMSNQPTHLVNQTVRDTPVTHC